MCERSRSKYKPEKQFLDVLEDLRREQNKMKVINWKVDLKGSFVPLCSDESCSAAGREELPDQTAPWEEGRLDWTPQSHLRTIFDGGAFGLLRAQPLTMELFAFLTVVLQRTR